MIHSGWSFYDYVELTGRIPFYEWMCDLPEDAQAWIDARILQMAGMRKWPEKWASKYRGTEKIIELRIPFNRVQYRPLGIYAPRMSFILLAGAIEKGGKLLPKDTLATAIKRQQILEGDPTYVRQHRYN